MVKARLKRNALIGNNSTGINPLIKIDELEIVCLFFVKGENTAVSQLTKSFTTVKNRLKRFGFVYFY